MIIIFLFLLSQTILVRLNSKYAFFKWAQYRTFAQTFMAKHQTLPLH